VFRASPTERQDKSAGGPYFDLTGSSSRNRYVGGNFLRVSAMPGGPYRSQPGLAAYPAVS